MRTRILFACLSAASLVLLAGGAAPSICRCPRPSPSPAPDQATAPTFGVHEWEGLHSQLNNVSASVNYSTTSWGSSGTRVSRSLTIAGMVADFTGKRIFRIAAPPRLLAFTDDHGYDLRNAAQMSFYPQAASTHKFTAPQGSNLYQNFNLSFSGFEDGMPNIGRVAVEVDVELAADLERHDLAPKRSAELRELAPNFFAGVTRYSVTDRGQLSLTLEYRIPHNDGPRPALYIAEVLDTEGGRLYNNSARKEIVTKDATLGTVEINNLSIGAKEVASVRLNVLTDLVRHTFALDERNLPVLSR